nr:hypothetical protein [Tanacetum cinerariifolium]
MANVYPNVHESLKFQVDEHVILEEPLSLSGTVSSMKNLVDVYTIRDQFINDESTEDEPGKLNVKPKVISMVTVSIHQASSSVPPLSTPIIDLSPPEPVSSTTQPLIFIATTMTTTTLPPPPQQQSTTESELAARLSKPLAPQSSVWKKSDTSEVPSSSSKQKSGLESEQPVKDVPMPETTHLSDTEDTDSAHLLKIKPRPEWLKSVPEEERPATLEPDWSIPTNDLPEPENN